MTYQCRTNPKKQTGIRIKTDLEKRINELGMSRGKSFSAIVRDLVFVGFEQICGDLYPAITRQQTKQIL